MEPIGGGVSFSDIPPDCARLILLYLNDHTEAFLASMVCKLFKKIIDHESFPLWLDANEVFTPPQRLPKRLALPVLEKIANKVQILNIPKSKLAKMPGGPFYEDQQYHLLPKFPNVRWLFADETRCSTYDVDEILHECCPGDQIEHLQVRVMRNAAAFHHDDVPPMYVLRHGKNYENPYERIVKRILSFSKLTSLNVHFGSISDAMDVVKQLTQLQTLVVNPQSYENGTADPDASAQFVALLSSHPNLIHVSGNLGRAASIEAPRWLSLGGSIGSLDQTSLSIICPKLEHLTLWIGAKSLHLDTPSLLQCHLTSPELCVVTDSSAGSVFSFPAALVQFSIKNTKTIFQTVSKTGCPLQALARDCPLIQQISLQYCDPPEVLRLPAFRNLEILDLGYSINTTRIEFIADNLGAAFPKLEELNLEVCSKLRAIDIINSSQSITQFLALKRLNVAHCWRLEVANLINFASSVPSLRSITANDLPSERLSRGVALNGQKNVEIINGVTEETWLAKLATDPSIPSWT